MYEFEQLPEVFKVSDGDDHIKFKTGHKGEIPEGFEIGWHGHLVKKDDPQELKPLYVIYMEKEGWI